MVIYWYGIIILCIVSYPGIIFSQKMDMDMGRGARGVISGQKQCTEGIRRTVAGPWGCKG
jgi:hypothetical protein